MPGSPATRTTAPGTRPPPSTRSSSLTPVRRRRGVLDVDLADPQGRRATRTVAAVVRIVGTPTSATEPHAWHSPHRPTHLTVVQPHSAQR